MKFSIIKSQIISKELRRFEENGVLKFTRKKFRKTLEYHGKQIIFVVYYMDHSTGT